MLEQLIASSELLQLVYVHVAAYEGEGSMWPLLVSRFVVCLIILQV